MGGGGGEEGEGRGVRIVDMRMMTGRRGGSGCDVDDLGYERVVFLE